jgi:hypothetical protein
MDQAKPTCQKILRLQRERGKGRFEFVETGSLQPEVEPGFTVFIKDSSLSGSASKEEIELLKKLRFNGKRPTPLYYYRELQSLRDPLHFRAEKSTVGPK